MQITVLGMGLMGRAMATRLLAAGHDVTVWNRTPGKAGEVVERGAREVDDLADAVAGAEVAMSVLTDDAAVRAVLLADDRPSVGGATTVVDCSTVAPETTRSLAGVYGDRFAACPVLGSPAALAGGDATVVVAGPGALVERLAGLWSSIGNVRRTGEDPSSALVVKLLVNYLLMAGLAVVAEAAVAGQAAGLPDDLLVDLFGAVAAPNLRNRVADVVSGDHEGWFPTPMGAKDVHLLVELGRACGVGLPVASLVASRYDEAAAAGLDDRDITAVVELLRRPA